MPSLKDALDNATGADLADALAQRVSLGSFLFGLTTEVSETIIPTSGAAILAKAAIPGTLRIAVSAGGASAMRLENAVAASIATGGFFVASDGKTLAFNAADNTVSMTARYLTFSHAGASDVTPAVTTAIMNAAYPATTL